MKILNRIIVVVALLTIIFGGVNLASASGEGAVRAIGVSPEIEGTWLVTVTIPDGPPPFPSLVTYARGGAFIVTDSGVPPIVGNVYQGAWTKIGPHRYAWTFLGFQFDEEGVLVGYVRGHETLQLEPGGIAYNGLTLIEILDIDMNVIESLNTTSHAVRIIP